MRGKSTTCPCWSWSSSTGWTWRKSSAAWAGCRLPRPANWSAARPWRCNAPTSTGWCIATSSPRTSCSRAAGEVKLLDLGLARFYAEGGAGVPSSSGGEEMTGTGQAMGTADYMAPEQASDCRTVDIRADLYGLGCTLYKLLSGRAPFSGRQYATALDKMNAHVHQPVPPIRDVVPDVPEELAAILERMLAKDPGDRFATPADVAVAMEPFCQGANLNDLIERAMASEEDPLSLRERARVRAEDVAAKTAPFPRGLG